MQHTSVCDVSVQRSPLETPLKKFLLGAGHISPFPTCANTTDSPKESRFFSINYHIIFTNSLGTANHSYQLTVDWEHSVNQVPRRQPWAGPAGSPF